MNVAFMTIAKEQKNARIETKYIGLDPCVAGKASLVITALHLGREKCTKESHRSLIDCLKLGQVPI